MAFILVAAVSTESQAFKMPGSDGEPSKKAQRLYRQALGALGSANYSKAIDLAGQSIKEDSKFAKAYALRGKALKNMGDMDNSLKDLNMAIKIDPNLGEAYFIRAQMSEIMGDMTSAKNDYKSSCEKGYKDACQ
jgi:tetratricopeptide (TPR) repeat protein